MVLLIGEGTGTRMVRSVPEELHEAQLTRTDVTSAVHYVRFPFTPPEVSAFVDGPVTLLVNHPDYPDGRRGVVLSDATRAALAEDLNSP